jgi:ribosomal protein L35
MENGYNANSRQNTRSHGNIKKREGEGERDGKIRIVDETEEKRTRRLAQSE